jgi:D-galactonate transporter
MIHIATPLGDFMSSQSLGIGATLPANSQEQANSTYRKITLKIVPLIFIGYIISYIDRVNVGFAKLQFLQDLHFTEAVYGLGAGLFFIGIMAFDIPSNLLLEKIGARATLSRIMILWGVISAGMAFVTTPTQFYVMRFLLGAAEAGFFPGVILYLSYWFPAQRRARITAMFTMGGAVAGVIGNPISGWLLTLGGTHGLRGWQIVFIYEGIPAGLVGVFKYFYLHDKPAKVKWLSDAEKAIVAEELQAEARSTGSQEHTGLLQALRDPILYAIAVAYIAVIAGTSTIALWAPTALKGLGVGSSATGFLTAIPSLFAVASMYFVGRRSDRMLERRWHYAGSMMVGGLGLALLFLGAHNVVITVALLTIAACGVWSALPVFWTIPPTYLSSKAKAGGIGFITAVGMTGGFISPIIVGWVATHTGSIYFGIATIGALLVLSAIILVIGVRPTKLQRTGRNAGAK